MKVLLVCSNPHVSTSVHAALLGEPELDVTEVATPQRAVAMLDAGEVFDVVVGDADTAPTGGFALCREIKARREMGRDMPPVVLLIARPQDQYLARWAQADAHVLKPADPFDLMEALRAVVAGAPVPALPGIGSAPVKEFGSMPGPWYEEEPRGVTGGGSIAGPQ